MEFINRLDKKDKLGKKDCVIFTKLITKNIISIKNSNLFYFKNISKIIYYSLFCCSSEQVLKPVTQNEEISMAKNHPLGYNWMQWIFCDI